MTKQVIATYGVKYITYQVEYRDGHTKEWLSAAGDWGGIEGVKALYDTEDSAKMVAKQLSRVTGKVTRVIKEDVSD